MYFDVMNSISREALSAIQEFQKKEFVNNPKPLDIMDLAYFFGLTIEPKKVGGNPGLIKFDSHNNQFKILIKPDLSEEEKRFTIAHELAHYLLHEDIIIQQGTMDMNVKMQNEDIESQANRLATYILMPMEQIYKLGIDNITRENLATKFGIPLDKVKYTGIDASLL